MCKGKIKSSTCAMDKLQISNGQVASQWFSKKYLPWKVFLAASSFQQSLRVFLILLGNFQQS